jgi:hypothetical protein
MALLAQSMWKFRPGCTNASPSGREHLFALGQEGVNTYPPRMAALSPKFAAAPSLGMVHAPCTLAVQSRRNLASFGAPVVIDGALADACRTVS